MNRLLLMARRHTRVVALAAALAPRHTACALEPPALADTAVGARPLVSMPALGQTHMNLLLNTSFTADGGLDGGTQVSSRMNYLKWEMKGKVSKDFSFHFRQSLTKKALPGEADKAVVSVDYANITWHITDRLSLKAGKQLLCLGGYEFWVSGYKVKEFSLFNDCMNNYGTGATLSWIPAERHTLSLQVVNSKVGADTETFCYGLPEGIGKANAPLLATVNYEWAARGGSMVRYSLSYGQQARGRNIFYFTSGHVLRRRALQAYFDLNFSYEGLDHKGVVSTALQTLAPAPATMQHVWYASAVADVNRRLSPHFGCFVKGVYECGGLARTAGQLARGVYIHEWQVQACAEYFPKKKLDLKFYLLAQYKCRYSSAALSHIDTENTDRRRLALGLVYAIPVF